MINVLNESLGKSNKNERGRSMNIEDEQLKSNSIDSIIELELTEEFETEKNRTQHLG